MNHCCMHIVHLLAQYNQISPDILIYVPNYVLMCSSQKMITEFSAVWFGLSKLTDQEHKTKIVWAVSNDILDFMPITAS